MINIVKKIRSLISDYLWLHALAKHKSRMGYAEAPKYTKQHEKAKKKYTEKIEIDKNINFCVKEFQKKSYSQYISNENKLLANSVMRKITNEEKINDIWDKNNRYKISDIFQSYKEIQKLFVGDLDKILREIFNSHYMIFYGVMYKSVYSGLYPSGSQLWHSDGGPGTCINVMFCLNETDERNGSMEFIPWNLSKNLFKKERKLFNKSGLSNNAEDKIKYRELICNFYRQEINDNYKENVARLSGPPGNIILFSNNLIHRGGFPEIDHKRYVCIFHVYPSVQRITPSYYIENGVTKKKPYPDIYDLR
jgi:hypothetical protein